MVNYDSDLNVSWLNLTGIVNKKSIPVNKILCLIYFYRRIYSKNLRMTTLDLPEDILCRITGFIHPDELIPLSSVNREWRERLLSSRGRITHHSLTSPNLLEYYNAKNLSFYDIKFIVEAGGNYDFYNNYLNRIRSISNNGYTLPNIMLDDSRYITKNSIEGILVKKAAMKVHPNMIGYRKPIELYHLEDYGLYMTNINAKEYIYILNRDNVLKCCSKYDNIRVMPMMLYDKCECIYHAIEFGAIKCLRYIVENFPEDKIRHINKPKSVHENVIEYVVDNWHKMEDYVGIEILLNSDSITPELISRIDLSKYDKRSLNSCNLAIVKDVKVLLKSNFIMNLYMTGKFSPEEPIKLGRNITYYTTDEVLNILTHPENFIVKDRYNPKLLTNKKTTLDYYLHDVDQFMSKYNQLKNKRWSGIISNPELYKRLVVKDWRYYYNYIGPLEDDMMSLKFKKRIGDPLLGKWPLNKLPMILNRVLTGYEKKSVIENGRSDIVFKYKLSSLKFKYGGYYYNRQSICGRKIDPHLVDRTVHVPPFCENSTKKKRLTHIVKMNIRNYEDITLKTDMDVANLLEKIDLRSIENFDDYILEKYIHKQIDVLNYGINVYNFIKHRLSSKVVNVIDKALSRSDL